MATALKIIPQTLGTINNVYDDAISFDGLEYHGTTLIPVNKCEKFESGVRPPFIHDATKNVDQIAYDDDPVKFQIKIYHKYKETKGKIESLIAYNRGFKVYYKFLDSPATYIFCVLDPKWIEPYKWGNEKASYVTILNFYEGYIHNTGIKFRTDVIYDPDGQNLRLNGLYDIDNISPIEDSAKYNFEETQNIELRDLYITINDPMRKFNFFSGSNSSYLNNQNDRISGFQPFYDAYEMISSDGIVGNKIYLDSQLDFDNGFIRMRFLVGDYVELVQRNDTTKTDIVKITAIVINFDIQQDEARPYIVFEGSLTNSYTQHDIVYKNPSYGRKVNVQLHYESQGGISETIVFRGIVRTPFQWQNGKAVLKLDNLLGEFLQKELRLHPASVSPTQRTNISGSLASTILWSLQAGDGTLSSVTTYTGARLGKWEILFSDATSFTVTGIDCNAKAGTTGSDFFDQTDATDSQIYIPSGNWGNTPSAGDIVEFYISANFDTKTPDQILGELLEDYGGLDSSLIDAFSASEGPASLTNTVTLSFDGPKNVGNAIRNVLPHGLLQVITNRGNLNYFYHKRRNQSFDGIGFGFSVLSGSIKTESFDIRNVIQVYYSYDYSTAGYQAQLTFPSEDTKNVSYHAFGRKRVATVYAPGIYSEAEAITLAKDYYELYAFGMRKMGFKEWLNIARDMNSRIIFYQIENAQLFIGLMSYDFNNGLTQIKGYSPNFIKAPE